MFLTIPSTVSNVKKERGSALGGNTSTCCASMVGGFSTSDAFLAENLVKSSQACSMLKSFVLGSALVPCRWSALAVVGGKEGRSGEE